MPVLTKKHPYPDLGPAFRALNLLGDKWTLPIIAILREHEAYEAQLDPAVRSPYDGLRFVELQRALVSISTEQLRTRVGQLVDADLLDRQRFREVPPRVQYSLTPRARAAFPVLDALAAWAPPVDD